MKRRSPHRYIPTDYTKFTKIQLLRRIESLEACLKFFQKREQALERTRNMFNGESERSTEKL